MFDVICIHREDVLTKRPLDLGFLAECLLFYQKVRILVDAEAFRFLLGSCEPHLWIELIEMGALEIEYFDNMPSVLTPDMGTPTERHDFGLIAADEMRFPQVLTRALEGRVGPSGRNFSRLCIKFTHSVMRSEYTGDLLNAARSDLDDQQYVLSATKGLLSCVAPEYTPPAPLVFQPIRCPDGFRTIETNIDFEAANKSYHRRVHPDGSHLSAAAILAHLAATRQEIDVASRHNADVALSPIHSIMAGCKLAALVQREAQRSEALDAFEEFTVESRSIREAVNSGQRCLAEVIELVRKAHKFKAWLKKLDNPEKLCEEYCSEVSHLGWADKLPAKTVRWLMMSAAGGLLYHHVSAGLACSQVLSAADALLLDKLLKGWRPNQFVEGPLKRFLRVV